MNKILGVLLVFFQCLCAEEYYSEDGQDKFVHENFFKNQNTGFYIDIGAHEGIYNNNTYFFEKLGWKGICFEPDPRSFSKLQSNRKCKVYSYAVGSKNGKENFIQHPCTFVSGLDRTYCDEHRERWKMPHGVAENYFIQVRVRNLMNILKKHNVSYVDFLSIDTEGAEKDIITSLDYDKCYFKVIVLENKYFDESITDFLRKKGFKFCKRLHRDEVFLNMNPQPESI